MSARPEGIPATSSASAGGLPVASASTAAPWTGSPSIYRALLSNLARLSAEVINAVEDGTWAVPEASRLHAWVKSELVPWSQSREADIASSDPVAVAGVVSDRGLLIGLNSLLSGSRGRDAAQWADEIRTVGESLIARIAALREVGS